MEIPKVQSSFPAIDTSKLKIGSPLMEIPEI
jgi:hypothetical protein